jgi:hypothetical protein
MIPIQRIVIGTQLFRNGRTSNGLFEHATKRVFDINAVEIQPALNVQPPGA